MKKVIYANIVSMLEAVVNVQSCNRSTEGLQYSQEIINANASTAIDIEARVLNQRRRWCRAFAITGLTVAWGRTCSARATLSSSFRPCSRGTRLAARRTETPRPSTIDIRRGRRHTRVRCAEALPRDAAIGRQTNEHVPPA